MAIQVSSSSSITINSQSQASDLGRWLAEIPSDASISVSVTKGDRPFDSGERKITARWTREGN